MIIIEQINHISVAVTNLDKAIDFYRDCLGFDVVERQSGGSDAVLQVGDMNLRLSSAEKPGKKSSEDYICFSVDMDDFDDAVDFIESENISILFGPEISKTRKKVVIADPDGNNICLLSEK